MIYVETLVRASMEDLWDATQSPRLHQSWDVRFTRITYLPRRPGEPQRFRYEVRPLPLMVIGGVGVTTAERHHGDGTRTSALRFASGHPLSPIRSGSGYWRYVPCDGGIRFLTGYRYDGWAWSRPLMGWATAWSFDRLRLWLETGRSPRRLLVSAITEVVARTAVSAAVAWWLPTWCALLVTAALVLIPPLRGTPAARRCRRRPPDSVARRPPEILDDLEET
ncbi:hypothetical protein LX16_0714 [Stackebrandtia albiflava]|uniref:Polyketide cyclase/dehydrase/lipid transport protein n=1 Tax=Stackebrandtia albiflava TaxID=406432 RepID=A0A562VB31_9ACTN|nr:hypothetical protein [Stackebrandtia albiflava]TWJ15017.1 hypothetical protein LX16_0714 [Stackebrandtia albiflava]